MNLSKILWVALFIFCIYLFVIVSSAVQWNPLGFQLDFARAGQFGDSFGPINTMMTALAALGAIGAYLSQKNELEEAKKSSENERKSSIRRDFESTFFSLIQLFRDTAKEIEALDPYGKNPVYGRDAITRFLSALRNEQSKSGTSSSEGYLGLYARNREDLGHYFRILYQIARFIDESEIENKSMYARILRANLSNSEIVILALNCVYGEGRIKFKPLVERYSLLHNISESDVAYWDLGQRFDAQAFGDRPEMLSRATTAHE